MAFKSKRSLPPATHFQSQPLKVTSDDELGIMYLTKVCVDCVIVFPLELTEDQLHDIIQIYANGKKTNAKLTPEISIEYIPSEPMITIKYIPSKPKIGKLSVIVMVDKNEFITAIQQFMDDTSELTMAFSGMSIDKPVSASVMSYVPTADDNYLITVQNSDCVVIFEMVGFEDTIQEIINIDSELGKIDNYPNAIKNNGNDSEEGIVLHGTNVGVSYNNKNTYMNMRFRISEYQYVDIVVNGSKLGKLFDRIYNDMLDDVEQ